MLPAAILGGGDGEGTRRAKLARKALPHLTANSAGASAVTIGSEARSTWAVAIHLLNPADALLGAS